MDNLGSYFHTGSGESLPESERRVLKKRIVVKEVGEKTTTTYGMFTSGACQTQMIVGGVRSVAARSLHRSWYFNGANNFVLFGLKSS
jgi:hypothetical protein